MMRTRMTMAALAAVTMMSAMPAAAQSRWDWTGGRAGARDFRLAGPGVPILFPELRGTGRGRAFVMRNFDRNRDGRISPREAEMANRAFAEVAGPRRDRFDWEARDVVVVERARRRLGSRRDARLWLPPDRPRRDDDDAGGRAVRDRQRGAAPRRGR